jgi:hypothetical protein
VDVQVDALEGLEAGGVGLGESADGDDGGHGKHRSNPATAGRAAAWFLLPNLLILGGVS